MIQKMAQWMDTYFNFSGRELGYARIFYGIYFMFFNPIFYLVTFDNPARPLPDILFAPPRTNIIYYILEHLPPENWYIVGGWMLFFCCINIILGVYTKVSSILLSLGCIFFTSIDMSFGKIGHNLITLLSPTILAFTNWGGHISLQKYFSKSKTVPEPFFNWPLVILLLCFFLGFFSAGLEKIVDFDYLNWSIHRIFQIIPEKNLYLFDIFGSFKGIIFESMDYMGLFIEIVAPFLLFFGTRYVLLFCFMAAFFGFFNSYVMGIIHHGLVDFYVVLGILFISRVKKIRSFFLIIFILLHIILIADFFNSKLIKFMTFGDLMRIIRQYLFYCIFIGLYGYLLIDELFIKSKPSSRDCLSVATDSAIPKISG